MTPKRIIFAIAVGIFNIFEVNAQSTLNIHQKDDTVVSVGFPEKPVVTYTTNAVYVKSDKLDLYFPFSNIEKISFENNTIPDGMVSIDGIEHEVHIYTLNGILIKSINAESGNTSFYTCDLPVGTYIIKQNNKSYKIIVRK